MNETRNNLSHKVVSANLGKYKAANQTLELVFGRWDPGCYVYKVWFE